MDNQEILTAALTGLRHKRMELDLQIGQLEQQIKKPAKRQMSKAGRAAIGKAAKARWAAWRKKQK